MARIVRSESAGKAGCLNARSVVYAVAIAVKPSPHGPPAHRYDFINDGVVGLSRHAGAYQWREFSLRLRGRFEPTTSHLAWHVAPLLINVKCPRLTAESHELMRVLSQEE